MSNPNNIFRPAGEYELRSAPNEPLDWNKIKALLPKVGCYLCDHGLHRDEGESYHTPERIAFDRICKQIKEYKDIVREYELLKALVVRSTEPCDKHYIAGCYTCSPLARIAVQSKQARSELGKAKFRLINLPTVANALGRRPTFVPPEQKAIIEAERNREAVRDRHPSERVFGRERAEGVTSRVTLDDRIDQLKFMLMRYERSSNA